jgi:hypothetical protein
VWVRKGINSCTKRPVFVEAGKTATPDITSYQQHRLQGLGWHAFFLVWTDASIVQGTEQVVSSSNACGL